MIVHLRLLRPLPFTVTTPEGAAFEVFVAQFRVGAGNAWAIAFRDSGGDLQLLGPLRDSEALALADAEHGIPLRVASGELRQELADALVAAGFAERVPRP